MGSGTMNGNTQFDSNGLCLLVREAGGFLLLRKVQVVVWVDHVGGCSGVFAGFVWTNIIRHSVLLVTRVSHQAPIES